MEFSLWHDTAQIKSLKLTSQKSSLEAQGKLTHFDNPRIEFTYSAVVDIGQLGAITRTYELRGGTLTASGSGNYSETSYTSRGKLAIRGFDYLQKGVVLHNANASADFSLDNNRLVLTRIAGRLLGGEIAGEATIDNLLASSSTSTAQPPAESGNGPRKERPSKSGKPESSGRDHREDQRPRAAARDGAAACERSIAGGTDGRDLNQVVALRVAEASWQRRRNRRTRVDAILGGCAGRARPRHRSSGTTCGWRIADKREPAQPVQPPAPGDEYFSPESHHSAHAPECIRHAGRNFRRLEGGFHCDQPEGARAICNRSRLCSFADRADRCGDLQRHCQRQAG